MDYSDKKKGIKKKLLEIERDKKINEARKDVVGRGLLNSGEYYSVTGPILEEYELKKQLIDEDEDSTQFNTFKNDHKPQLFDSHKSRYRYHSKLEKLFRRNAYFSYEYIAVAVGIIKKRSQYRDSTKKQILGIKDIFNSKSIKLWGEKLKATRNTTFDGLELVPAE